MIEFDVDMGYLLEADELDSVVLNDENGEHEPMEFRPSGGDCEYVIEDNMNESEGMGDVWFRCTNCNTKFDYYADDWLMKQNYCPHCGFKIRKAVKR